MLIKPNANANKVNKIANKIWMQLKLNAYENSVKEIANKI